MEIRKAKKEDKALVLKILDEFNDYINSQKKDWDKRPSSLARDSSGYLYDEMIDNDRSMMFIAIENNEAVGFLEIHKVPRLRRAKYYGEIEGIFVRNQYYGKGIAQDLMKLAYKWGKESDLDCIRLYSGHELKRAHSFYKKMGFDEAGITFKNYDLN